MPFSAQSRRAPFTTIGNPNAAFTLADVRLLAAADPSLLPAASEYARRFHPRTTLARAA